MLPWLNLAGKTGEVAVVAVAVMIVEEIVADMSQLTPGGQAMIQGTGLCRLMPLGLATLVIRRSWSGTAEMGG